MSANEIQENFTIIADTENQLHKYADVSTDTLPILHRRLTDILPTHCRCYRDRLSVDLSTEGDPMIGRSVADARPTLARYSTDNQPILGGCIDRDLDRQSIVSRPTYRPLLSIEAPYKTQDPETIMLHRLPQLMLIYNVKINSTTVAR